MQIFENRKRRFYSLILFKWDTPKKSRGKNLILAALYVATYKHQRGGLLSITSVSFSE